MKKGFEFRITNKTIKTRPQCSLRTVTPIDKNKNFDVKLSVSLQTTSSMRTISKYAIHNGFSLMNDFKKIEKEINNFLSQNKLPYFEILFEIASAGMKDAEHPEMFACILREHQYFSTQKKYIPVAYLADQETNLKSELSESNIKKFVRVHIYSFLYALLINCMVLECHCQNIFSILSNDAQVIGLCYKDFGGMMLLESKWSHLLLEGSLIQTNDIQFLVDCFFHDFMSLLILIMKTKCVEGFQSFVVNEITMCLEQIVRMGVAHPNILKCFLKCITSDRIKMKALTKMAMNTKKETFFFEFKNPFKLSSN